MFFREYLLYLFAYCEDRHLLIIPIYRDLSEVMLSGFYNDESIHGDYDTVFNGSGVIIDGALSSHIKSSKKGTVKSKSGIPIYSFDDADAAIRREVEQESRTAGVIGSLHHERPTSLAGSETSSSLSGMNFRASNSPLFSPTEVGSTAFKPIHPMQSSILLSDDTPPPKVTPVSFSVVNVSHSQTPSDGGTLPLHTETPLPQLPPSPRPRSSIPIVVNAPEPSPEPFQPLWKPAQNRTLKSQPVKSPSLSTDDDTISSAQITQAMKQNEIINALLP